MQWEWGEGAMGRIGAFVIGLLLAFGSLESLKLARSDAWSTFCIQCKVLDSMNDCFHESVSNFLKISMGGLVMS